ncbi:hypothetical protein WN55_06592 [Dufourea novaeangliae]|uniref:Uncharacterized protein n=1 Tax=Dufourea novaeangliae TaxID=178035 RepID=A0A154PSC9_DUFNO|nr:hypothetical protein WN55_06592 [Dufourea novaeangliae]
MRFRRGGGKWKKTVWRWKGKMIEEVKEYKYLGYTLMRNGQNKAHVRKRVRTAGVLMKWVRGRGKRRFGQYWRTEWRYGVRGSRGRQRLYKKGT